MSARRFAEWQAYFQLEPFGPVAGYWQAALIASTLANVNRTKKSQKVFTPEDFMPRSFCDDGEPERDAQRYSAEVMARFKALAGKHGE